MKIWIDLANSPHVLFFRPIISELHKRGHAVLLTARDFAQTLPLIELFNLDTVVIGEHGGGKLLPKAGSILSRGRALAKYIKGKNVDLAVGHNSYAQIVGARLSKIPVITLMDYEHQPANHVAFRLADIVVVPEVFPDQALRRFGAGPYKVKKYNGLKEQVYLSDFAPDPNFTKTMGLDERKIIVTLRPPANMALYHRFENDLFPEVLQVLAARGDCQVVFLPRVIEQRVSVETAIKDVIIPDKAIDGLNLLYFSDIVIGAGGTMNREAAVLGTPVYSLFAGKSAAVDQYLADIGILKFIRTSEDFAGISWRKKTPPSVQFAQMNGLNLLNTIVELIIKAGN